MTEFIEVGAGWTTKKGTGINISFKKGTTPPLSCTMFPNKKKEKPNHPDYKIFIMVDSNKENDLVDENLNNQYQNNNCASDDTPF